MRGNLLDEVFTWAAIIQLSGHASDVRFSLNDVRFTSESGHVQCNSVCPLVPIANITVTWIVDAVPRGNRSAIFLSNSNGSVSFRSVVDNAHK